jgi:hypothetical protein
LVTPDGASTLDPNLPLNASGTALDANFGLHWKGMTMPYFIGVSATHLTQPTLANVNFTKARHYYVMAGYEISNIGVMPANLTITPSLLFKTDGTAGITDFNVLGDFWFGSPASGASGVYGGLTYRTKDAFAIMFGFQKELIVNGSVPAGGGMLKGSPDVMKIGYSYDVMTNKLLGQYGSGSHELVFNYCVFAPPPPVQRYGNVFILQ